MARGQLEEGAAHHDAAVGLQIHSAGVAASRTCPGRLVDHNRQVLLGKLDLHVCPGVGSVEGGLGSGGWGGVDL
jgi:hypothetical protein